MQSKAFYSTQPPAIQRYPLYRKHSPKLHGSARPVSFVRSPFFNCPRWRFSLHYSLYKGLNDMTSHIRAKEFCVFF